LVTIRCCNVTFPGIQAIIFDKDGTLADSASYLRSLGQKRSRLIDAQIPGVQDPLLMAFGLDGEQMNPAGLLAMGNRYENEIAAAAYVAETGRDWLESLTIVRRAFEEADIFLKRKSDHTPLFPGVLEILQALATENIKLGILSADTTANVRDWVQRYELKPYFHLCMGTESPDLAKPNPALFQQACTALEVPVTSALMVGDTRGDLAMAKDAQAAGGIGVGWGWTAPARLEEADVVIEQLGQIQIVS